jgi:dipeptidyl aminopeptidase/acylaminoacyl peptidase
VTDSSSTRANREERVRAWLDYPTSWAPSVSADGAWVYYLSNSGGLPRAWRVSAAGGSPQLVTSGTERVARVEAAPQGAGVVLSIDAGGNEHYQLHLFDGSVRDEVPLLAPLTQSPAVIHSAGGWRDGHRFVFASNDRDRRFFDVHELDTRSPAKRTRIHSEDALVEVGAVRGESVVLTRANTNLDVDLFLVRDARTVRLTPHEGELTVFSVDIARDGVLAAANPGREFAAVVRYREPGPGEVLREYPGDVEVIRAAPDGRRAAVSVNRDGWSEVHLLDLDTNDDHVVPTEVAGTVESVAWMPDGEALCIALTSAMLGTDIYRWDVATHRSRLVTRNPQPLPEVLPETRLESFVASDGLTVPYWDLRPRRDPPRGTIILVHGGPEAQARPRFDATQSFLRQEGWRLVLPNVRGSLGYGRTYVHLDDVRKRMDSVRDLRDLVRHLVGRGEVLPGELGIMGGSYGGFMVLSAISTYPELWGAAVDVVGIANMVTFLERTGVWRRKVREDEYGSLEHDREFLESISPIHHTDAIRTPLLVVHGANDPRVPVGEAEQIVAALKARQVPVEFLRYENEGHGLVRRENRLEAIARAAEHFERHLTRSTPVTPFGSAAEPPGS